MNAPSTTSGTDFLKIDGSHGEGGGQVIRTAVSLAAITGIAIEISNIRAGRRKPGLQAQHLTSVRAAAAICNAALDGDQLDSVNLQFSPKAGNGAGLGDHVFDVSRARGGSSAGSASLVAQTIIAPMLHRMLVENRGETKITVRGGTHVPMAPCVDYIEIVYLPALSKLGHNVNLKVTKAGFFPRGGGEIELVFNQSTPHQPLDSVSRGRLQYFKAIVTTSGLKETVAERAAEVVKKELKGYGVPISVEHRNLQSSGEGAAVLLTAECSNATCGWTALGERGKPIERVAAEAIKQFQLWYPTHCGVDEHLSDQLILPCALAGIKSQWSTPVISEHLRTVIWIVNQFLEVPIKLQETDGVGKVTVG